MRPFFAAFSDAGMSLSTEVTNFPLMPVNVAFGSFLLALMKSVSTGPGQMQVTVIPLSFSSSAIAREKEMT